MFSVQHFLKKQTLICYGRCAIFFPLLCYSHISGPFPHFQHKCHAEMPPSNTGVNCSGVNGQQRTACPCISSPANTDLYFSGFPCDHTACMYFQALLSSFLYICSLMHPGPGSLCNMMMTRRDQHCKRFPDKLDSRVPQERSPDGGTNGKFSVKISCGPRRCLHYV